MTRPAAPAITPAERMAETIDRIARALAESHGFAWEACSQNDWRLDAQIALAIAFARAAASCIRRRTGGDIDQARLDVAYWREHALAHHAALMAERARCATIARQWIKGAPTTTTETVVAAIAEAIESGATP